MRCSKFVRGLFATPAVKARRNNLRKQPELQPLEGRFLLTAIQPAAFGPAAIVESFEALQPGPNIDQPWASTGNAALVPGTETAYTFASGVTLTQPIPNNSDSAVVLDFAYSNLDATWGLSDETGDIDSPSQVPFGTAYLGWNMPSEGGSVEFTFPTDMSRVGAYAIAAYDATHSLDGLVTMSAYDANGTLLETVAVGPAHSSDWGTSFLGIENAAGIRKVTFNGDYMVLDGLTFERPGVPPTAVAGGPYTVVAGQTVTLDGSASTDDSTAPLDYAWDLNSNGVFGEIGEIGVAPTFSAAGLTAGVYTVSLRVTDADGLTSTATATINVLTAAQFTEETIGTASQTINDLGTSGTLTASEAVSMQSKLDVASAALQRNNTTAAGNQITAVINQIRAILNRKRASQETRMALVSLESELETAVSLL